MEAGQGGALSGVRRTAEPLRGGCWVAGLLGLGRAVGLDGGRQEPLLRASFRALHGAQHPHPAPPPGPVTGLRPLREKKKKSKSKSKSRFTGCRCLCFCFCFCFLFFSSVTAHVACPGAGRVEAVGACRATDGATRGPQERLLPSPAASTRPARPQEIKNPAPPRGAQPFAEPPTPPEAGRSTHVVTCFCFSFFTSVTAHIACPGAGRVEAAGACRATDGATRGPQERLLPSPAASTRPARPQEIKNPAPPRGAQPFADPPTPPEAGRSTHVVTSPE